MLAMVGIPLGIATRKGGRARGTSTRSFLAFFCYYLAFICLTGLAQQQNAAGAGRAVAAERCVLRGGPDLSARAWNGRATAIFVGDLRGYDRRTGSSRSRSGVASGIRVAPERRVAACRCCRSWWIPTCCPAS